MEEKVEAEGTSFFNVGDIVKRAKKVLKFKPDSDLAAYLGVSRSTLSNWVIRNRTDFPLILEKLKDYDYNWLLTGKGSPKREEQLFNGEYMRGPNGERIVERNVGLYDITAAPSLKTLLANKRQYLIGKIQMPGMPACDGALYISGDSMYPVLKSGDIVGFKEINNFSNVIYGEMYIVSFNANGDEYLTVKYVNRSEIDGCIKLVSNNPHHEPMDVSLTAIQNMAIVKFSIHKNITM